MANYQFSLQSVLDWREDEEESAKMKVKALKDEKNQVEKQLKQLINENVRLKEKLVETREIDQLRQQDLYKNLLNEKIIKQKLVLEEMENKVRLAEDQLLKAYQDKKVMEKLDEKEKEEYIEQVNAEEQKQIDEFSTISFSREDF